jgi:uncharacterized protein YbaR (Trm112 family)
MVKRAREQDPRAAQRYRGEVVVVRGVTVDDVESLALHGFDKSPDVARVVEQVSGRGKERPRPPEGEEPRGERAVRNEAELRLDSAGEESGRLIEHDRGRAGPLLAGDELEEAHRKKLSAVTGSRHREGDGGREPPGILARILSPGVRLSPEMAVDPELLSILVCPKTKGPLEVVELTDETRRALIEKYREKFRDEEPMVTQGLYSKEADLVYPIVSDIPVMLIDEALPGTARRTA